MSEQSSSTWTVLDAAHRALRGAVAGDAGLADVVRRTLRELLPAVAESLTPPEGAEVSALGASADELRSFALGGLTRRLNIIGVPLAEQ